MSDCSVSGCEKPAKTRGMCGMHTERVRRYGVTDLPPVPTDADRFWLKVIKTEGCWIWNTPNMVTGYGQFTPSGGRLTPAHRVSYEWQKGAIPGGLEIDHLCRNRACVNPAHLEAVTHTENVRRGEAPTAIVGRTNRCKRDHELTPENTYVQPDGGRQCRICAAMRNRKACAVRQAKRNAARAERLAVAS